MNTLKKDETGNANRAYPTKFEHGWSPLSRNREAPGGDMLAPGTFVDSLGRKVPHGD